jgi:phosphatidate phosphatase LPIN
MDVRKAETELVAPVESASGSTTERNTVPNAVVSGVKEAAPGKKKYAKTLRLTSDQLVSSSHASAHNTGGLIILSCKKRLNLKEGANLITFSLSEVGAAACTARIFLWDSTDLIVVSDIDGTITKYAYIRHFCN